MYNPKTIREILDNALEEIKEHFVPFFQDIDYNNIPDSKINIYRIQNYNDLNSLPSTINAFYVILSNYNLQENFCTMEYEGCKAVYRGHGSDVYKRIQSHLFNSRHKDEYGENAYTECMQIKSGVKGVDIDQGEYKNHSWYVITHSIPNSTIPIREQAELAFDIVYSKPFACND